MPSTPCPVDADLVDRLVQRIATLTGQPVQVVRVAEGITPQGGYHCLECTTWYPSALAAAECADMDAADRLRHARA